MARKVTGKGESATGGAPTIAELKARLKSATADEYAALERAFAADTRKGVLNAFASAKKRLEAEAAEAARLESLYAFQAELANGRSGFILGLDEVGRGPLAGPLAIGGVVLSQDTRITGLNDSKQLSAERREEIAAQIKDRAVAWTVQYVQPHEIDAAGMTASLVSAFKRAIADIESQGVTVGTVLLDGNPLHLDPREISVVKGDAKCAAISAASIVAKVDRDNLMVDYAHDYPEYGFDSHKGYGSAAHIAAIKEYGLTPIHRVSFCTSFTQETLF